MWIYSMHAVNIIDSGRAAERSFSETVHCSKENRRVEMKKELRAEMKNLSRDERVDYFKMNKSSILDSALSAVNGGKSDGERKNPNSEIIPFEGNWFSSDGYVCNGEVIC
jgi:hypothetical protein